LQNSPLESSCVVVALVENYSTSKPLKVSPEKYKKKIGVVTILWQMSDKQSKTSLNKQINDAFM